MADKYIIHGATYCGDGTASNEAASAGAAGAWNDINVLEGTAPAYGTAPAAGHVVAIRSKTSAGADITRTLTAAVNLGSTNATATNPITWVLDDGTIWSGVNGVLTYTAAGNYTTTFLVNNVFVSKTRHNWIRKNTAASQSGNMALVLGALDGVAFDTSVKTSTGSCYVLLGQGAVIENPLVRLGRIANVASDNIGFFRPQDYLYGSVATLINPEIELVSTAMAGSVFTGNYNASCVMRVIGGRIYGAGATTGQAVFSTYNGGSTSHITFDVVGLQIPRSMDMFNSSASRQSSAEARIVAADDLMGGHYDQEWGYATSRTDNNPPYLAGELPDSAHTAWAYRVYPRLATVSRPMVLNYTKLYTGTAAAKDISLEILVANTMAANKRNLWISVSYTDDTTGLPKCVTTRDHADGALDASTANWSATVWGMVTLLKRKFAVTTPTAVKQNTPIIVTLFGTLASATANDIYFVDPDFGVN